MGLLVGKYVKVEGQSASVGKAGEVKQEMPNSVFTSNLGEIASKIEDNDWNPLKDTKIVTTINADGSKTEKRYGADGKLCKEIVLKDVNGDGKEDIYSVTGYMEAYDDPVEEGKRHPAESKTFIDEDGDGYYDTCVIKVFDEKGKLKSETKTFAEDINDVKKREHFPWEVQNRKMDAHYKGVMMM